MGRLLSRVTRRRTQGQIRYVSPVSASGSDGLAATVYAQVEREFGILAPPVSLHAPAPEVLAGTWLMLRETLVATGLVPRESKEAVAVAVSGLNACPYCVEVHSIAFAGLTAGSYAGGSQGPRQAELAAWAGRCDIRAPAGPVPSVAAGAELAASAAELIGTAVTFHYLNRMVNIFLVESPIPGHLSEPVQGRVRRVAARLLAPILRRPVPPGQAAGLLPAASLPKDLRWATGAPAVADAFARAAAAIESAGQRAVPEPVRRLVLAELASWDGCPPGLGDWTRACVARLPTELQAVGRLAMLTALASYQVTEATIEEVRGLGYDDRRLIELTAWSSLTAARHIGSWLGSAPTG